MSTNKIGIIPSKEQLLQAYNNSTTQDKTVKDPHNDPAGSLGKAFKLVEKKIKVIPEEIVKAADQLAEENIKQQEQEDAALTGWVLLGAIGLFFLIMLIIFR